MKCKKFLSVLSMAVSISLICSVSEAEEPRKYDCLRDLTDCVKMCSDQDLGEKISIDTLSEFCETMNSTATPSTYLGCNKVYENCMKKLAGLNDDKQTKGWSNWGFFFAVFIAFAIGGGFGAQVAGDDHFD